MDKIEIKNASIIDGLGGEPYFGNIYLRNGKISAITRGESLDSDITIDATGKIVTPGFIDLHTHSDVSFLLDSTAQSKIRQGVTLELIGNCGMSTCTPLPNETRELFKERVKVYNNEMGYIDSYESEWKDFNGYIDDILGWDREGAWGGGSGDNDPYPKEGATNNGTWAHGTHVAGILSATIPAPD